MADGTTDQALANFDRAHAALLHQPDLQFHIAKVTPPPPPAWQTWLIDHLGSMLKVLGPMFRGFGHVAPWIFWPALIVGLASVLYLVAINLFGAKRGRLNARFNLSGKETPWRPNPEQARALLEEADRLAAEGLYAEAAHLILLRSIEDIAAKRPRLLAPSYTSRDIARIPGLPDQAREMFAGIAQAVELSLFGGLPLDSDGFSRCRQAYQDFAHSGGWA